ncbi:L-methionine/branched-chain amino acid transporter [Marinomonas pollencensis]|uniref:Amino acid exporter (AAE family) n=1 Tax=Marinomonas pollencensis TaxID=491954 RepID=A0A3E0DFC8_9GAMM|nr:L-methionine/branched-chain amino acid transporter [Marinomonas pollencensis]REG81287.1 amino acid exporter (AAE family) [Marinomonas pollencensis]
MEYQRTLGPLQGIAMTVTTFIGTGLMLLPALSVSQAQGLALYAWLVTTAIILPVAFVFALLGSRFPSAGGASHYIGRVFGPKAEKAVGWLFLSILLVGPAVAINIAAAYLAVALNLTQDSVFILSIVTVFASVFYALAGIKNASHFQSIVVIGLIIVVVLLSWQGDLIAATKVIEIPTQWSQWQTALLAMGTIFWCFIGIEVMAHMGAEFKNPARDFPIALLGGMFIVIALYLALVLLITHHHTFGDEITNSQSLALLVGKIFGEHAKKLFAIGAFIIAFANTGMYLLGFARMVQSMSSQGALPSLFSYLSKDGTPVFAVYFVAAMTLSSILLGHFSEWSLHWFIEMTNGAFLLIYTLTCITSLKLLPNKQKWLGLLASASCLLMTSFVGISMLFALCIFAIAAYFEYHKARKKRIPDHKIHVQ